MNRREEVEAIVGPATSFHSAADQVAMAAAERAVIDAAISWATQGYDTPDNEAALQDAVAELLRLRATIQTIA